MTSGFGKVILLGEHAVVYGYPALAGAVALRVAARVSPADSSSLVVPAWELKAARSEDDAVGRALGALLSANCPENENWRIAATSTLPARAGLGSSAALSVAITRALAVAHGEELETSEVEARAGAGERCFHDTPSGVDVAVAARGGLGLFTRKTGLVSIDARPVPIAIGLTGEPRQTSDLVARVASAKERDPASADAALARLGELAELGAKACKGDQHTDRDRQLGAFFREAQTLLASLDVSSPGIEEMVAAADEAGALGAKLTGAGGGGAVIAIAPGREEEIASAWRKLGHEAFVTEVGVGGNSGENS